jgi:hypothetical protein
LPIKAVQFTILSIIAMGYEPAVAPYGSEASSIFLGKKWGQGLICDLMASI